MDFTIGDARSVQIEWKYGLNAITDMIGFELPLAFRPEVISDCADWSERFNVGRVRQTAMGFGRGYDDIRDNPHYVRPGCSLLNCKWTTEYGTVHQESVGHPTVFNQRGQVVQNEIYVDRSVRFILVNPDWPDPRPELISDELTYHVSEMTSVDLVPFTFEVPQRAGGNVLAISIGQQMHQEGYRPATLTETLWYAAKYQDEIGENQILVPWAGYSGGFAEGKQLGYHLGLPFVVRHRGVLKLAMQEFLGQWMPVDRGVEYLAVKIQ